MSDGIPELASLPSVYHLRHQPVRYKRSQALNLYEEHVVRIAGWRDDQAPVVARLQPGIGHRMRYIWPHHHGERDIALGRPEVVYRAIRGADGRVRLASPLMGEPFLGLARAAAGAPVDIEALSRVARLQNPGNATFTIPGRAAEARIGHIISSSRNAALAYSQWLAQTMALVDGIVYMPCGEPAWLCEKENWNDEHISMFADNNPGDSGLRSYEVFVPYGMKFELVREFAGYMGINWAEQEFRHIDGAIVPTQAGLLGSDPCWSALRMLLQYTVFEHPEMVLGMSDDEADLHRNIQRTLRDWPSARDGTIVAQASRLVRVAACIMPNKHGETIKSMQALEAWMGRMPATPDLEARMAAAGMPVAMAGVAHGAQREHAPAGGPGPELDAPRIR